MSYWQLEYYHRYLISKEKYLTKFSSGDIKIVLVYPNEYEIAMSNLGFQGIFNLLSELNVFIDRAFLPPKKYLNFMLKNDIPLFSLYYNMPLSDFDIIAFSVSFELDVLNVLKILKLAKIPLYSKERQEDYPLIILGGALTYVNVLSLVKFIDIIFLGESEIIFKEFINFIISENIYSKMDIFYKIKSKESLYIYNYNKDMNHILAKVKDINLIPFYTYILTNKTIFKDTFLIELTRGCPFTCKFCIVRKSLYPYRFMKFDLVKDIIKRYNIKKIGLVGAAIGNYPYKDLFYFFIEKGIKISVSSLRVDFLKEYILKALKLSNVQSITLAPETGDDNFRKYLGKNFTNLDIINSIDKIYKMGFLKVKLYFIIGLPNEDFKVVKSIVDLLKMIKLKVGKIKLSIGVSIFISKPNSDFFNLPMQDKKILKEKLFYLKTECRKLDVDFHSEGINTSYIQGLIANANLYFDKYLVNWINNSNLSYSNFLLSIPDKVKDNILFKKYD